MRKTVVEINPYFVEQDFLGVKLNQNESPYDLPASLKSRILAEVAQANWNRYPLMPPNRLLDALARETGFSKENIVVGNSANEIIQAIALAICAPGEEMVVVSPGFSVYPRVGRLLGLKVVEAPLDRDYAFDETAILVAARTAPLVIFSSPNNPTGTVLDPERIHAITRRVKGFVVVDEAYQDFFGKSSGRWLGKDKNLIIIRTLSKAFGAAGARLGYMFARPEIAAVIEKVKLPFSLGVFQQIAGPWILRARRFRTRIIERITAQREFVFGELKKIPGIHPIPSQANFILFEIRERTARNVFESLRERGVLVRSFDHPRLKQALRVTIGTPRENVIFLKELDHVMGIEL